MNICANSIHLWLSGELASVLFHNGNAAFCNTSIRHRWKQTNQPLYPPPRPSIPPACSCLNNEVTSPSWLQSRSKKSIVSITMRKNEGPLLMRRMWCPCPSSPQHHFPPPAPCHTHLTPTLPPSTSPSLTVTLSSNLWEKETFNAD